MSLKRVVLLGALAVLLIPAAKADTVQFGWHGGAFDFTGSSGAGLALTNDPSWAGSLGVPSVLDFLNRLTPTPMVTFGSSNLGSVLITTGQFATLNVLGNGGAQFVFNPGGSLTITSNSNLAGLTGGAIPNGTTLFNGSFTGQTTFTQTSCFVNCTGPINYQLAGTVYGFLSPVLSSYFGFSSISAAGWVLQTDVQLTSNAPTASILFGDAELTVPEPGTLALFGTGLIGLAGMLRRKLAA